MDDPDGIGCPAFMVFNYKAGGTKMVILREYAKILITLADLGGFLDILG